MLNPRNTNAYNNRGFVYTELKDYQKAVADFTRVLEIDSQNSLAYYNRAYVYERLGNKTQAIADFKQAATLYQQQGNLKDYQEALQQIEKLNSQELNKT